MDRRTFLLAVASLPLAPTARSRILVLGDSVAWGQGLLEPQKMHNLLAAKLLESDGAEASVIAYGASGAIIGTPDMTWPGPVPRWWPREIPQDRPTLYEQVRQVVEEHPDRRFDAIVVVGGINDVNVRTIYNPFKTTPADIVELCDKHCRQGMSRFLQTISETFVAANPQVKVLVCGYYPVLSGVSKLPSIKALLKAFAIEYVRRPRLFDKNKNLMGWPDPVPLVTHNSQTFNTASKEALSAAVAEANARINGANFQFVDPGISDQEAAFTPNALIFGLDKEGMAQDELIKDREVYCKQLANKPRGDKRFTCERASVGHPNSAGARRYAEALFAALKTAVV